MTPDAATLFLTAALRQVDNGYCSTHITADQLAELATCYRCKAARLEDAERRLAEIAEIVPGALLSWACNYRDVEREAWAKVERLSKPVL